uniref:Uncharacterized protein n=1 Tax=Anguilla anguilla TaxID=7936 RepID=A0A0E9PLX0_ANGAN
MTCCLSAFSGLLFHLRGCDIMLF